MAVVIVYHFGLLYFRVNFKVMKNAKALVWGLSIVGVGLAVYIVATLTKKDTTNKSILSPGTIGAIGDAISGLFSKKTPTDTGTSDIGGGTEFNNVNTLNYDPSVDLGYTVTEATEG
jgi:hypothetical protein